MVCWRSVTQSWGKNTLKSLSSVFNHEAAQRKPVFPPAFHLGPCRHAQKRRLWEISADIQRGLVSKRNFWKGYGRNSRNFTKAKPKSRDQNWQVWTPLLKHTSWEKQPQSCSSVSILTEKNGMWWSRSHSPRNKSKNLGQDEMMQELKLICLWYANDSRRIRLV